MKQQIKFMKYYTPELEDLHLGYVCQEKYNDRWFDVEVHSVIDNGAGTAISEIGDSIRLGSIRTKYLDREDIESLGYTFKRPYQDTLHFEFGDVWKIGGGFLEYNTITHQLKITTVDSGYNSDGPNSSVKYKGKCPSINELRKILKLIK